MPYYFVEPDRIVYSNGASSPGTGWVSTTFSSAINQAITSNLPLFLLPATISTGAITFTITSGSPNRLVMTAMPGTVTVQLNANAAYLFEINAIPDVVIDGIIFDASNKTLTENVSGQGSGIFRVTQSSATNIAINNCKMLNANNFASNNPQAGIVVDSGCFVRITNTVISNCGYGILSINARVWVSNCTITYGSSSITGAFDNGVVIFRGSLAADGSVVENCTITQQSGSSTSSSNGNYGNGVLVYQAGIVRILNNIISGCHLSAIRVNAAFYSEIIGNNAASITETAIFVECPGSGQTNTGGIVSNNVINGAGQGINAANLGLYSDGVTKFISVTNNQIFNVTQNAVPNETSVSTGGGIMIGGYTIAVGNLVQGCAVFGICVGTNNATIDLMCNNNYISGCPMGITYSANASVGKISIVGNVVSAFRYVSSPAGSNYQFSGAIVSSTYGSSTSYGVNISPNMNYLRDSSGSASNTDYGNTNVQTANLLIANNIAS